MSKKSKKSKQPKPVPTLDRDVKPDAPVKEATFRPVPSYDASYEASRPKLAEYPGAGGPGNERDNFLYSLHRKASVAALVFDLLETCAAQADAHVLNDYAAAAGLRDLMVDVKRGLDRLLLEDVSTEGAR